MKLHRIRVALLSLVTSVVAGGAMWAQTQGRPGVQVAVPQGSTQDQAAATTQQQRQQDARARLANEPAPRTADGHIVIGNTSTRKGVWVGGNLGFCNANRVAGPASLNPGATAGRAAGPGAAGAAGAGRGGGAAAPCTPVPYMDWTLAMSDDRRRNELEPHTRCKPSGGPRQWLTPYGAEFLELAELKLAYIFDIGGPHTYRTIYMDGRSHPRNLTPSYYGHSIGWWEGDTLVVDTIGFNEGFWIDRGQLPHTNQLHLLEKYTRTSVGSMRYELTVDDPGAYTKPFTGTSNLRWEDGTELFEYVCQQANQAYTLMVGEGTSVDRTTLIVP
ncbi:MAG TPA: hypothetical protein VIR54_05470 [Vicinamibacterales bacterium]